MVVTLRTKTPSKWLDQLSCKVDFIYSGFLLIKTFKSNLSNLHISLILLSLLLVILKMFWFDSCCALSSIHGHKYFLTIVDDYSRYTWVFPLKQKYEVVKILEDFVVFIQTQFETKIKVIRSDNEAKVFMTNILYFSWKKKDHLDI